MSPEARRPSWAAVGVLTLVGFGLRAFHMNAQSLWFDEIGSVRVATTPVAELLRAVATDGNVDPTAWLSIAYYALLKSVLLVPHTSPDWILRFSSVVVGTATIPALAWAAAVFVPASAALAATAALAISPFHVWYSQEVRPYALLVLIATLLLGAFVRALDGNRARWWCTVAVLMTVALYTHPIALALPMICGLGVVAAAASPRRGLPGIAALIASGVAFLPAVLVMGAHGANHPADPRPVGWLDLPYAFYAYAVGFSLGPSTSDLHAGTLAPLLPHVPLIAFAALVFGGLGLRGAAATRRLAPLVGLVLWVWLVVPLALALAIAVTSANPFNVRYAIVSFPAFVLLLGLGASDVRRWPVGALAASAVALALVALANLYFDPRYAKEDCRGLAAVLGTEAAADDLVVVNAPYMASAVSYYYPGPARVIGYPALATQRDLDFATMSADLARLAAGRAHVWLISTRTFHGDAAGTLQRALAASGTIDRALRLPGIAADRYVLRPGD